MFTVSLEVEMEGGEDFPSGHYLWLCTPVFLKSNQFKNLADP